MRARRRQTGLWPGRTSAALLPVGAFAALVRANARAGYPDFWATPIGVQVGSAERAVHLDAVIAGTGAPAATDGSA